jgi:predicted transposase YbfD/YdcC
VLGRHLVVELGRRLNVAVAHQFLHHVHREHVCPVLAAALPQVVYGQGQSPGLDASVPDALLKAPERVVGPIRVAPGLPLLLALAPFGLYVVGPLPVQEHERDAVFGLPVQFGQHTEGKHIAIDGKTLRRSFDRASRKMAIHMVNAYVHENHAVFGQLKVDDKTNEITAIAKLLEMLQLKEATVTIDTMGCQRDIARKIIDRDGHYVLALKGNQGTLQEDTQTFMDDLAVRRTARHCDYYETIEKSHGRIEIRKCWSCWNLDWLIQRQQWPGLSSMVMVEATRTLNGKTSTERRYFISSHSGQEAQKLATLIRNHWRVENQLHWTLDVSFNEDQCRVGVANAAENLARIRRISLVLLKNEKTCKLGIKSKRAKAGYDRSHIPPAEPEA